MCIEVFVVNHHYVILKNNMSLLHGFVFLGIMLCYLITFHPSPLREYDGAHRGSHLAQCKWQSWASNLPLSVFLYAAPSPCSPSHDTGFSIPWGGCLFHPPWCPIQLSKSRSKYSAWPSLAVQTVQSLTWTFSVALGSSPQPCFSLWTCASLCCLIALSSVLSSRSVLMRSCLAGRRGNSLGINAALAPEHSTRELGLWAASVAHSGAGYGLVLLDHIWKTVGMLEKQSCFEGWVSAQRDTSDRPQPFFLCTLLDFRIDHTCLLSSSMPLGRL